MQTTTVRELQKALSPELERFKRDLNAALAPAKLYLDGAAGTRNGRLLQIECSKRGIGMDAATQLAPEFIITLRGIINDIYADLEWEIPPAKLLRDQQKPDIVKGGVLQAAAIADKIKAADAAIAKAKQDEKIVADIYTQIGKIYFTNKLGRPMLGHTGEAQAILVAYVKREVEANHDRESIRKRVLEYINKEYEKLEKAATRV
jgi:hypothetical protein